MATNAVDSQTIRDIVATSGRTETFVQDVLGRMITSGARPETIAFGKMFIAGMISGGSATGPAELAQHLMSERFFNFKVVP